MTQTRDQQIDDLMGSFPGWSREQVAEHLDERERDFQRSIGSAQTRTMFIATARAKASELGEGSPERLALTALAEEFEKALSPREAHTDGVYGAYLEGYRTALTGAHFIPARGVFAQTAAALGATDGTVEPPAPLRTRGALFEAVVGLLQRRE
jgi:hypothetical protein